MKPNIKERLSLHHKKNYFLLTIFILGSFLSSAQYAPEAFVTKWKVPFPLSNSQPIDYINLIPEGAYHYELFKLDGNNTHLLVEEGSHYGDISFTILEEDTGIYILSLIPDENHSEPFHRFMMSNTPPSVTHFTSRKLIELIQWGTTEWSTFDSIMAQTSHLQITATDIPNLNNVTSMASAFTMSHNLISIPNMNQWDVSGVQDMQFMFSYTPLFNENISDWDVSNVQNMYGLFISAQSFNQDIGNWDVSNVQNMEGIFGSAHAFNQDIGNWNVSNVTNMGAMFGSAHAFNQDIGNWDVSNVTNMRSMFINAHAFNQNIGNWDVSHVTNMYDMFQGTQVFNQDIGNWDVSKVTNMSGMFFHAQAFNQDISHWNTTNVVNMYNMFQEANAFNQNLGVWSLENLETAYLMFNNSGMSCENYSLTLKGWSENAKTAHNVELGAANMKYSPEIEQERNHLINSLNWNILGDALGTCTLPDDPIAIQVLNEEHLNLYPNPVRSTLTINFADHINIQSIHVYNITGQKVMEVEALNQTTLEVDHLKSGIYFVEIKDQQQHKIVKKFVKL